MEIAPTSAFSLSIGTKRRVRSTTDVGQPDDRLIPFEVTRILRNVGNLNHFSGLSEAAKRNLWAGVNNRLAFIIFSESRRYAVQRHRPETIPLGQP